MGKFGSEFFFRWKEKVDKDYAKLYIEEIVKGKITLPEYIGWMNTYDVLAGGKIYNYHLIDELPWILCMNKMLLEYERYLVDKHNNK